ncbi:hypothetical protein A8L34_28010 [Bacillus sp. FJAT-27264]|uniref:hypothetical protein n=1 Tax=Paenibacillus sp. (strain DSM 101736 / FJAT-27264) TaxID=1850362 RepID=UPI000807EF02|nr:hypothetical protein [Bacillus sp. FJAT-27264]OBZ15894.1 hypothetical protein A8L34_28010 [Bacillus sp. FJAT-27264]
MPEIGNYDDVIRIRCDKKFKENLQGIAKKRGESLSDFSRKVLEAAIDESHANEGVDHVAAVLGRVLQSKTTAFENRLAAMVYKDTVASATAMNLLLLIAENLKMDAPTMFQQANAKAVSFSNNPLRDQKRN